MKTAGWPVHEADELEAVTKVLSSGCTNYWTGTEGREFEKEFAAYIGTKYAVALMNGTVALEAALYALDIGPGDEVITTCRTFIASASCVVMRGAKPVLADVDAITQNITVETIMPLITRDTKAIIVVHLAGWPADMKAIMQLARQHNIKVIEDCAQAVGAMIDGKHVGAWGDIAAFSFCQDKIMTTGGEGGMITTDNEALWQKIWTFKDHGKSYDKVYHKQHPPGFRWLHDSFGTNWRMTETQAAIGRVQLKKLPEWLAIRKRNADYLSARLAKIPGLRIEIPGENIKHAHYKYYVFIQPEQFKPGWDRDRVMQALNALSVPCFSGSCSEIYLEQAFQNHPALNNATRPVAKCLGETSLMLLIHPTLSLKDMEKMADALISVMQHAV